jgi:hypothetical protein
VPVISFSLLNLSSPASYLIALILPALDAFLPIVPSETVIVALGVATADRDDPRIVLLVGLAACGAFIGAAARAHGTGPAGPAIRAGRSAGDHAGSPIASRMNACTSAS